MNNPRFKMMLPWKAPFLGHFPPCPQNQRVREVQTCHRPINHWSVAQSRLAAGIAEFRTGTGFQRPSQRTPDFLLPSSISKTSTVQSLVNNITNKTSKKGTKAKYVGIDGSRQTWNITPSSTKRSDYTSNCIPISMSSGAAGPSGPVLKSKDFRSSPEFPAPAPWFLRCKKVASGIGQNWDSSISTR
jgi:hypothetical protein